MSERNQSYLNTLNDEGSVGANVATCRYGIQPAQEMSHIHGVCDPHMNSLSLQVRTENI